jgi:hypothetical protein
MQVPEQTLGGPCCPPIFPLLSSLTGNCDGGFWNITGESSALLRLFRRGPNDTGLRPPLQLVGCRPAPFRCNLSAARDVIVQSLYDCLAEGFSFRCFAALGCLRRRRRIRSLTRLGDQESRMFKLRLQHRWRP